MTNDGIREAILRFLYDRHRSARGVTGQEIGIRDLQTSLKASHNLTQQQVASNLDYLVQKQWVLRMVTPRAFTTPGGTRRSEERVTYKISAEGIDRVEGDSRFPRNSPFAGINITNVSGVTVVGDGNLVRSEFATLGSQLDELHRALLSTDLPEETKIAGVAEVQTIKSQLAKSDPDKGIIQRAWSTLQGLAGLSSVTDLLEKVRSGLQPFLN